jgi:hypothetical protein
MITPALVERGLFPLHLRKDGTMETTNDMEDRLVRESRVGVGVLDGLFASLLTEEERRAIVADAYRWMARKKAFVLETDPAGD